MPRRADRYETGGPWRLFFSNDVGVLSWQRREARLARRSKALARVGLSLAQGDTAEAEANMSDGDDR